MGFKVVSGGLKNAPQEDAAQPIAPAAPKAFKVVSGGLINPNPPTGTDGIQPVRVEGPKPNPIGTAIAAVKPFAQNVTDFFKEFTGTDDVSPEPKRLGGVAPSIRAKKPGEKFGSDIDPQRTSETYRRAGLKREIHRLRTGPNAGDMAIDQFMKGIIPDPSTDSEAQQRAFPLQRFGGQLVGLLGAGKIVGPVSGTVANAIQVPEALHKVATIAKMAGGRMAQSGATFGLKELTDNMAEIGAGEDKTLGEVAGKVAKHAAFGVGLGAVGSIASPLYRIPSEAAYGYATAKLEGAENFDAGVNAVFFSLFALLNRHNLSEMYKTASISGARKAFVDEAIKKGVDPVKAERGADMAFNDIFDKSVKQGQKLKSSDFDELTNALRRGYEVDIPGTTVGGSKPKPSAEAPAVRVEGPAAPGGAPEDIVSEGRRATKVKAKEETKPAAKATGPTPQWLKEEYEKSNLRTKGTPLVEADLQNQSVRDAIASDPALSQKAKEHLLGQGAKELNPATSTDFKTYLQYDGKKVEVKDAQDAQGKWAEIRTEAMKQGARQSELKEDPQIVQEDGRVLGRLSWNGKFTAEPEAPREAPKNTQLLKEQLDKNKTELAKMKKVRAKTKDMELDFELKDEIEKAELQVRMTEAELARREKVLDAPAEAHMITPEAALEGPVSALSERWSGEQDKFIQNVEVPLRNEIDKLAEAIKSKTTKPATKKKLREEMLVLQAKIDEAGAKITEEHTAFGEKLAESVKTMAKEKGLEPTDDLVSDVMTELYERPGIESNWDMPVKDAIGSALDSMLADKAKAEAEIKRKPETPPNRVASGGKIQTKSGRMIPQPPRVRTDTNRKATADLIKLDTWLLEQGRAEATATNNDYVQTLFKGLNPKKLSQGDKDTLNEYLFGESDPTFTVDEKLQKAEAIQAEIVAAEVAKPLPPSGVEIVSTEDLNRFIKAGEKKPAEPQTAMTTADKVKLFNSFVSPLDPSKLSANQRELETAEIEFFRKNIETAIETYEAACKIEYGTDVPNIFSSDLARTMNMVGRKPFESWMAQYRHAASSALINAMMQMRLQDPANAGKPFMLLSGISGAGKTSIVKDMARKGYKTDTSQYVAVLDTNSNKAKSAIDRIDKVLAEGRQVTFMYVDRDPIVAFKQGVWPRFKNHDEHRPVSIPVHVDNMNSRPVAEQVIKHYANNPNFEPIIVSNNGQSLNDYEVTTIDNLPVHPYTRDGATKALKEWIDERYLTKELIDGKPFSRTDAETFLGRSTDIPADEADGGQVDEDQPGAEGEAPRESLLKDEPPAADLPQRSGTGGLGPKTGGGVGKDRPAGRGARRRGAKPDIGQDAGVALGNPSEPPAESAGEPRRVDVPDTELSLEKPVALSKAQRKTLNDKAREILKKPIDEITSDEKEVLRQYTGVGGLQAAEKGVLNQHYTSYEVIDWIWKKIGSMGANLSSSTALEAATGVGNFIGFKPSGVAFDAVELDPTASKIAQVLYPNQRHYNMPFERFQPNKLYDISVGNDPFGSFRGPERFDPIALDYKEIPTIHDFFLAKRLDLLKPNGVMAVITSIGTMDKTDPSVRRQMNRKAEFLAGYRLPDGIFRKNTQYDGPADILIFRKRTPEEIAAFKESDLQPEFVKALDKTESGFESNLSSYFKAHPENVWGTLKGKRGQFGHQTGVIPDGKLAEHMEKALADGAALVARETSYTSEDAVITEAKKIKSTEALPYGAFKLVGGKLYSMGTAQELFETGTKLGSGRIEKVETALTVLSDLEKLVGQKTLDKKVQKKILKAVEAYRTKHKKSIGYDSVGLAPIATDPRYYRLAGLMTKDGIPSDILTKEAIYSEEKPVKPANVDDIKDVVRYVQESAGRFDYDIIKSMYRGDANVALMKQPGMNIEGERVVPDEEYLYGDIHAKIDMADAAGLKDQVAKLEAVLPTQAKYADVESTLHAPYIDTDVKNQWLNEIGIRGAIDRAVNPDNGILEWSFKGNTYGGPEELRIGHNDPIDTILKYLNHEKEYETVQAYDGNGNVYDKRVVSKAQTEALKRADQMFAKWLGEQDAEIKNPIVNRYNRMYRHYRRRDMNKSELQVKGLTSTFYGKPLKILPHQWEMIWQWVYEGRGINAHGVGGGKTLTAIVHSAIAKQMGKHRRPLFVVPGKVIQNWSKEAQFLFPQAKIMSLELLDGKNANKMFQQIAMNEFDYALISIDRLKLIPLRSSEQFLADDVVKFESRLRELNSRKTPGRNRKKTEREIQERIEKKKEQLRAIQDMKKTNTIFFEDMLFDAVYVDEAHNYKNVSLDWGTYTGEQGLTTQNFSDRANDLDYKLRYLHGQGKHGAYLMTATPTPNNPIEIYAMLRYINPELWPSIGIQNAGDFLDRFADIGSIPVVGVDGVSNEKNVVAGYKNLNELREIFKRYADFRPVANMEALKRPEAKYHVVQVPMSADQMNIYGKIASEIDFVKSSPNAAKEQGLSMLSLTTQGRQASVGADIWDAEEYANWTDKNSKISHIVDKVSGIFKSTGSGQLIFLDIYKGRRPVTERDKAVMRETGELADRPVLVNYHSKIRKLLAARGIPENQIAIVNGESNNSPKLKQAVSDAYNEGKYKVVIGTTQSMGEGMNLQADTIAIHNLDVPWTPDALTQRNGRGLRQGNRNELIDIFNYVTKGSLDAFMYDKLAKKDGWNKALWLSDEARVANINLDQEAGLSYEELSTSLTINKEVKSYWIAKRSLTAAGAEVNILQLKMDHERSMIEKRREAIEDRKARITEYEELIAERTKAAAVAGDEPDLSMPQTRMEGHRAAIQQLSEEIEGYEKEFNRLSEEQKGVKDKVLNAQNTVTEYEAKKAGKPAPTAQVEEDIQKESLGRETTALFGGIPQLISQKKPVNDRFAGEAAFSDPDTEARYRAAHGMQSADSLRHKIKKLFEEIGHRATRVYPDLPNRPEYAELRNILAKQSRAKPIAQDRAIRAIDAVTAGFGPKKLDVFTRKIILDDLAREAAAGRPIPFGYSDIIEDGKVEIALDRLMADKRKIDSLIEANPDIKAAVEKRNRLWHAVRRDLVDFGILTENQLKEDYFRHQVLEYATLRGRMATPGTGKKLKTPRPGYSKRRQGSTYDINSSYVEAEFEVLSKALYDIETARHLDEIENSKYNVIDELKAAAKQQSTPDRPVSWRELIPEGYTTWQPLEGRVFYSAVSLSQKVLNEVIESAGAAVEVSTADLRKVLAVGGMRKEFVVEEGVKRTLDNLYIQKPEDIVHTTARVITTQWKKWVLFNPRRAFKYNLQNFIGDMDAVIAGQPKIFKNLGHSVKELAGVFYEGKVMSSDMREFFMRGGVDTELTVQEIPEIRELDIFKRLHESASGVTSDVSSPKKALDAYWERVIQFSTYRESLLRYAAYLYYKDVFLSGGAEYGASNRKEIDAIADPLDKAAKVAIELLGDYSAITAMGQELRQTTIPFFSFWEINAKRYYRLTANAFEESNEKGFGAAGRMSAIGAAKGGLYLLRWWLRLVGLTAAAALYNHTFWHDEEQELNPYDQNRMHLVLGRNSKGHIIIMRGQGAFSDILEWFGLNEAPTLFRDYWEGKASLVDIFGKIPLVTGKVGLKPIAQKFVRGISPLYKMPFEVATGKQLPSFDEKSWKIEDKTRHVLRSLQLENEYDKLTGQPTRGYFRSLAEAFITTTDPEENAYRYIQGEKYKFLESKGFGGSGDFYSPNSIIYRKYKKALRFGDKGAQAKLEGMMIERGIFDSENLGRSLAASDPLFGLSKERKLEFFNSLSPRERVLMDRAYKYYFDTFKTPE